MFQFLVWSKLHLLLKASGEVHNSYVSLLCISGQSLPQWKLEYQPLAFDSLLTFSKQLTMKYTVYQRKELHACSYQSIYEQFTDGEPVLKHQRFSKQRHVLVRYFWGNINLRSLWLLIGIDFYCKQYLTECIFSCVLIVVEHRHHCYDRDINLWKVL